jgi:TolB-like protein/class 3 adenylate cyclase
MANPTRQLAAVMFTDMVGYTALMQQNETLAVEKQARFRKCFEESIARHNGKVIQYYGDGVMSVFTSALQAVRSAIETQTQYLKEPRIDARIGIHTGEIMTDGAGAYGDGVNIASRMESLAVPGSIFISDKLFHEIQNQQDIRTKPLGYFELKNVHQPMQVYAIANEGVIVPSRDEVKGKLKQTLNSIAVLPFVSLSADPENEYFCDGLSEELINVLSKIEGVQITARTSAFAFKGRNADIREIAAQLNVQKVIEGSVRKGGNKVRITVQLINAVDGYHIWSETYDRSLEDIFEVQDEISRSIANKLRSNLSAAAHEHHLVKAPTDNLEAYKKYLQGLYYWNLQKADAMMLAMECFQEAVALEPSFVNPYYNIVYITAIMPHFGLMSIDEASAICSGAAEKAMALDPMNARSHLIAGLNAMYFEWDMDKAHRHITRAIELNPNLYEGHFQLGWYYMITQQRDKIQAPLDIAHKLDPIGGETVPGIGEVNFFAGNLEVAEHFCDEGIRNYPDSMYANTMKALLIGANGDWTTGLSLFEQWNPDEFIPLFAGLKGYAYGMTGQKEKAQQIIDQLVTLGATENGPPVASLLALIYIGLGDRENFYFYFEEAHRIRSLTILYFYNSPLLAAVNGEERIKEVRKKYGLPV